MQSYHNSFAYSTITVIKSKLFSSNDNIFVSLYDIVKIYSFAAIYNLLFSQYCDFTFHSKYNVRKSTKVILAMKDNVLC